MVIRPHLNCGIVHWTATRVWQLSETGLALGIKQSGRQVIDLVLLAALVILTRNPLSNVL